MCLIETKEIPKKLPKYFYKVVTITNEGELKTILDRSVPDWKGIPLEENRWIKDKNPHGFCSFLNAEDAAEWLKSGVLGKNDEAKRTIEKCTGRKTAIYKIKIKQPTIYGVQETGDEKRFEAIASKQIKLIERVELNEKKN